MALLMEPVKYKDVIVHFGGFNIAQSYLVSSKSAQKIIDGEDYYTIVFLH